MRNNGKGGMQTTSIYNSILCPLCHKPAATAKFGLTCTYMHFTKKGVIYHIKNTDGTWTRKRHL